MMKIFTILLEPVKSIFMAIWEFAVFIVVGDTNTCSKIFPSKNKRVESTEKKCGFIVPMQFFDKMGNEYKDVAIYSFYYDSQKRKIYGLRHFQGWEYAGWREIELKDLFPRQGVMYKNMGVRQNDDQVEYKEGGPTVHVFGYVKVPSKKEYSGNMAVIWDPEKRKLATMHVEDLIDVEDPQFY